VDIFNLDHLVIFGPGSEWFWAMAQFVVVVVSLGGIYVQLRAQSAANALQKMEFFISHWDSDAMAHDRLVTAIDLKYGALESRMAPSMVAIADFWETLAELERSGHINDRDIWPLGRSLELWWALLEPAIRTERLHHAAGFYEGWERLVTAMRELDRKVGETYAPDNATIPGILDDVIRINTGMLERSRAVAGGDIPRPPNGASSA